MSEENKEKIENDEISNISTDEENIQKSKKQRTPAQIEATKKMREKLYAANEQKKKQKEENEKIKRKELEDKIVNKALSIKKKQIKKERILEEISDDETPIEEVKKIIKRPVIEQPQKPKYIFM